MDEAMMQFFFFPSLATIKAVALPEVRNDQLLRS
jgi:hypothetical protein